MLSVGRNENAEQVVIARGDSLRELEFDVSNGGVASEDRKTGAFFRGNDVSHFSIFN